MSQSRKDSNNNNATDDSNIEEDRPVMRSVAMLAPPMPMARASPLERAKQAPAPSPFLQTTAFGAKEAVATTTKPTAAAAWDISAAPAIPPMYFLERTHVRVSDAPVKEIAFRIAECLRKHSIPSSVDADDEALLLAETPCHMQFAIRLWKGDSNNQTVVEVQRSAGCSYIFHQISKAVLRSSKGESARSMSPPRTFAVPDCIPRETEQERKDCLQEGLDIACSLLAQNAMDAQVMAIESLIHLTKVCKCQGYAAQSILSNEDICRQIVSMIEESPSSSEQSDMEEGHLALMRCECLHLLANCLDSLKQHGKLQQILHTQRERLSSQSLVMALVEQMSHADDEPHLACQAIRCLQTLSEASSATKRLALQLGVTETADRCTSEGQCRSVQLQEYSEQLRQTMATSADHL